MIAPALRSRSTKRLSAAGTKFFRSGEPQVERMPLTGSKSLTALGKAVERPLRLAARQLGVALPRLRQQLSAVLQRDDRVDLRIYPLDMIEGRAHDFDARGFSRG